MADVDWEGFSAAVTAALTEQGLSGNAAAALWPRINNATISHATRGKRLDAGNYNELCHCLGLDPYSFVVERRRVTRASLAKAVSKQTVKAGVPRETAERP